MKTLQWGHALSGMDILHAWTTMFRAYALQWGHALSGMDMPQRWWPKIVSLSCFNGAMPFQAWIYLVKSKTREMRKRFNGAMPFQAWIYRVYCGQSQVLIASLQWGHALSGMDMLPDELLLSVQGSASMGPCPFRHGYLVSLSLLAVSYLASMGPCPFRHGYKTEPASPGETRTASMGPCPFRHGYTLLFALDKYQVRASMGPCPFRHGYAEAREYHQEAQRLQWGHALSGMDMWKASISSFSR